MDSPLVTRIFAATTFFIGVAVLAAWTMHVPTLIWIRPDWAAMAINTALCLSIGGATLAIPNSWRSQILVQRTAGAFLLVLATAVLAENLWQIDLGIDWSERHHWLTGDSPHAGRMAPNTCFGFMLIGCALILTSRSHTSWRTWLRLGFALITVVIGAVGLLGYLLRFELLYNWSLLSRMAAHTAFGITLLGTGLWISARRELQVDNDRNEDGRDILAIVSGSVSVISIMIALGTVAFMMQRIENLTTEHLQRQYQDRSQYFTGVILQSITRMETITAQTKAEVFLRRLIVAPNDPPTRDALQKISQRYLPQGFNWVAFLLNGAIVAEAGSGLGQAQMVVTLYKRQTRELVWRDGFYLRLHLSIRDAHGVAGEIVTEQPLDALTNLMASTEEWGETSEMVLCTLETDPFHCFPSRAHRSPFMQPRTVENTPLPMTNSLNGAGTVSTRDDSGQRVLAAYGPVGTSGLGMVLKMDLAELYAPVIQQLKIALVVLALAVFIIRWLVQRRLQPLVKRMVESRQQAKASEARFLTAAENNLDAFYILESIRDVNSEIVDFRFTYLNDNGARLISNRAKNEIVDKPLCELFPLIREQGFFDKYKSVTETGNPLWEEFPISAPHIKATWLSEQVVRMGDGIAVTARDISEQKEAEQKLKYLAQNDMLTGLPNRALFFDRLKQAIVRSRRHKRSMALLFMDIDHFKGVNDTLGHAAGDALLRTFAERLRRAIRESDTAARLAGDEFTAILEDLNTTEDAEVVAKRIIASMQTPITLAGNIVKFTSSIGIAMYPGSNREISADELLEQADSALYEAKKRGRNGYALHC